ncbi:Solute carrier family 35 member G1 [Halotydeus destructor]|nr:Solute carrier family 35 member G1 [Halotydeus destructor]
MSIKKLPDHNDSDGILVGKLRKIPLAGIILATISGVIFATGSFCVTLTPKVEPLMVLISRSLLQVVVFMIAAIVSKTSLLGVREERWTLIFRGVAGAVAVGSSYSALHLLPLADASSIVFSSPVFVFVLACFVLGEPCGLFQVVMVVITVSGVVLISKPTFIFGGHDTKSLELSRLKGTIFALMASVALGFGFILVRRLRSTSASVIIIWMSAVSILLAILTLAVQYFLLQQHFLMPETFSGNDWLLILANGVCGVFGQLTLTLSVKIERAGVTSLARSSDIVVAYIYQVAFLSQPLQLTSVLGSAMIMFCVIASALVKLRESKDNGRVNKAEVEAILPTPVN